LRRELFTHLQRLSLSFQQLRALGRPDDQDRGRHQHAERYFCRVHFEVATQTLEIIGMFTIMLVLNWRVGVIALATLPFLGFSLCIFIARPASSKDRSARKARPRRA